MCSLSQFMILDGQVIHVSHRYNSTIYHITNKTEIMVIKKIDKQADLNY